MNSDRPTPVGEHYDTVPMDPPAWDIEEQSERVPGILPGDMLVPHEAPEKVTR